MYHNYKRKKHIYFIKMYEQECKEGNGIKKNAKLKLQESKDKLQEI